MKYTTTLQRIRNAGACIDRYKVLRKALADTGMYDVVDVLQVLESNGPDDISWLMGSGAVFEPTAPAWAEYERVTVPAWAEYERVKAPAWAEYNRVTATAWAEYERVTVPAWERILS